MTAEEKNEPTLLKQERVRRVAKGSGVAEKDVRDLIAQWNRSRKMMKGIKGNRQMRKQMKQMMRKPSSSSANTAARRVQN